MFWGLCNTGVTKANYAKSKTHYKSGVSESWRFGLAVTKTWPRLSQLRPLKIIFAGRCILRPRFACPASGRRGSGYQIPSFPRRRESRLSDATRTAVRKLFAFFVALPEPKEIARKGEGAQNEDRKRDSRFRGNDERKMVRAVPILRYKENFIFDRQCAFG